MAILNQKYSHMMESLSIRSGRAAVIAALCICAEQTFSQGFAKTQAFVAAFSQAFHAYLSFPIKSQVESAIATLPLQHYEQVKSPDADLALMLVDIIITHQLRIPVEAA
ncbi:hypothetical protein B0H13DRAFT_2336614 [Mycena leptocephala]|nr:hypothetical protein B0H13DRAFT_2336614 [Mycena leptocephala]